jgi:hypothetical protein
MFIEVPWPSINRRPREVHSDPVHATAAWSDSPTPFLGILLTAILVNTI